ncbi:MAG: adenosine kinase [Parachlamydia sp.]|nr:MAG: adenosine kinase [Parachlamydia sp.]
MELNAPFKYEILGLGNPIIDYIMYVDEDYVAQLSGYKGGMEIVDFETIEALIKHHTVVQKSAGGSATNTIKGLAHLGKKCGLIGKIGDDLAGREFTLTLQEKGIASLYQTSPLPTGKAACLITPDGQRTFRTYPGPMSTFQSKELDPTAFKNVQLVYLEGYNLLNIGVTERAMALAKEAGAKVAFDLSSVEMALNYKPEIMFLLEKYVDILFSNAEESTALTQAPPAEGCQILKELCETVVIHAPTGCWVGQHTLEVFIPTEPITPLDSTGAGDLFTSGFLYGYLAKLPIARAVALGAHAGKEVVQILGAELPVATWKRIQDSISA